MKLFPATFLLLSAIAKAGDTNSIPALAPTYGELPPTFWEQHQTTIINGAFSFCASGCDPKRRWCCRRKF